MARVRQCCYAARTRSRNQSMREYMMRCATPCRAHSVIEKEMAVTQRRRPRVAAAMAPWHLCAVSRTRYEEEASVFSLRRRA